MEKYEVKELDLDSIIFLLNDLFLNNKYGKDHLIKHVIQITKDVCSGNFSEEQSLKWIKALSGDFFSVEAMMQSLYVIKSYNKEEYFQYFKNSNSKTVEAFLISVLPKKDLIFMLGSDSKVVKSKIEKRLSRSEIRKGKRARKI